MLAAVEALNFPLAWGISSSHKVGLNLEQLDRPECRAASKNLLTGHAGRGLELALGELTM